MDNKFQQKPHLKFLFLIIFIIPIFFAGCSGNSIEENSTVVATVTKIILPSSTQTQTITPTITTTITPSPTLTLVPTPTSTPIGNAQGVLLGVCTQPTCTDKKILFLDIDNGNFTQIGEDGFRLHDISPDGKQILYSSSTDLFVMNFDGSGSYLLSDDFDDSSFLGAFWSLNNQIIFIKNLGDKKGVFKVNSKGTEQVKIFEERRNIASCFEYEVIKEYFGKKDF